MISKALDVRLTRKGSYYCDQGPHDGMMAVPFAGTAYMTTELYNAVKGEVHVVAGAEPEPGERDRLAELVDQLYDLGRAELRELAWQALLASDGPDRIDGDLGPACPVEVGFTGETFTVRQAFPEAAAEDDEPAAEPERVFVLKLPGGRPATLTEHCEYQFRWRRPEQKYDRLARLGFLGPSTMNGDLLWTADPDGGTVKVPPAWIIDIREVAEVPRGRYVDKRAPADGWVPMTR